jgi:diguanylate cyclase (GGDEF)-like protein/PAS domain S-box-containing protein
MARATWPEDLGIPEDAAARLLAFFERTSDMIGVADDAGRILYVNAAARQRLGLPDDLAELSTTDLFPESTFTTYFEEIRPTVLREGHWSGYVRVFGADHEQIDVWLTVVGEARTGGDIGWLVTSARDITEWRQARDELSWRATHDELTGLAGRVLLADRLELALARAQRSGGVVAVMFVDLDDLKFVNDVLGHHAGDEAIVEVARRLTSAVRAVDTVARVSGDEFVVVSEGLPDDEEAAELLERLRAAVSTVEVRSGELEASISASVGMALSHGELDSDELLRRADAAMYDAKRYRARGAPLRPPSPHTGALPRLSTHEVASAVSQRLVSTRYQPVFTVEGDLFGYQALARLGRRKASAFMDHVEGSGVGLSLDLAVLRQAADAAASWRWTPAPLVYVHVSSRFLVEPQAARYVSEILGRAGIAPERLALQIPEQLLARRHVTYVDGVRALRALGVRLVVANVGLRSPAMTDLAEGLFDELRLALPLALDVRASPSRRRAVTATTAMAHALGLLVTAVGVEDADQRDLLVAAGCDLLEGDLLGEAVPASALLHR